jgi:hypothetical protein
MRYKFWNRCFVPACAFFSGSSQAAGFLKQAIDAGATSSRPTKFFAGRDVRERRQNCRITPA